jgi:hypothetical protein
MNTIQSARQKYLWILGTLLAIALAAGAFLLSPWGRSLAALQDEYRVVRRQFQARRAEADALSNMPEKIERARAQVRQSFDERLPARYSEIAEQLGRHADRYRVGLSRVRYELEPTDLPGVQRVLIDATLDGSYINEVKFINALERDQMFFIVDSVSLGEERAGAVRLELKLETYLRSQG